jgi:hypothetical protein
MKHMTNDDVLVRTIDDLYYVFRPRQSSSGPQCLHLTACNQRPDLQAMMQGNPTQIRGEEPTNEAVARTCRYYDHIMSR